MKRKKILALVGVVAVGSLVFYLTRRRRNRHINKLKAEQVSEHGYETAHDVLFPKKKKRVKRY